MDRPLDKCCWRVDGGIWCGATADPLLLCSEHWQQLDAISCQCPAWEDGQHQYEVQVYVGDVTPGDPQNQIKRCACGLIVARST